MFGYGGARLTANKIPYLDGLKSKANNWKRGEKMLLSTREKYLRESIFNNKEQGN